MDPRTGPGPGRECDTFEDEPLREEDVTAADKLDDRVSESEGLPDGSAELPEDDRR